MSFLAIDGGCVPLYDCRRSAKERYQDASNQHGHVVRRTIRFLYLVAESFKTFSDCSVLLARKVHHFIVQNCGPQSLERKPCEQLCIHALGIDLKH